MSGALHPAARRRICADLASYTASAPPGPASERFARAHEAQLVARTEALLPILGAIADRPAIAFGSQPERTTQPSTPAGMLAQAKSLDATGECEVEEDHQTRSYDIPGNRLARHAALRRREALIAARLTDCPVADAIDASLRWLPPAGAVLDLDVAISETRRELVRVQNASAYRALLAWLAADEDGLSGDIPDGELFELWVAAHLGRALGNHFGDPAAKLDPTARQEIKEVKVAVEYRPVVDEGESWIVRPGIELTVTTGGADLTVTTGAPDTTSALCVATDLRGTRGSVRQAVVNLAGRIMLSRPDGAYTTRLAVVYAPGALVATRQEELAALDGVAHVCEVISVDPGHEDEDAFATALAEILTEFLGWSPVTRVAAGNDALADDGPSLEVERRYQVRQNVVIEEAIRQVHKGSPDVRAESMKMLAATMGVAVSTISDEVQNMALAADLLGRKLAGETLEVDHSGALLPLFTACEREMWGRFYAAAHAERPHGKASWDLNAAKSFGTAFTFLAGAVWVRREDPRSDADFAPLDNYVHKSRHRNDVLRYLAPRLPDDAVAPLSDYFERWHFVVRAKAPRLDKLRNTVAHLKEVGDADWSVAWSALIGGRDTLLPLLMRVLPEPVSAPAEVL